MSKAEAAYLALKEEILNGKFFPKERILERELTKKFNISKTPIREALTKLKQEGLLIGTFYQGMQVIRLTEKDIQDIFELRELLEGLAAKKVAESGGAEIDEELRNIIDLSEKCLRTNPNEFYRLNLRFHNVFRYSCSNQQLTEALERLFSKNSFLFSTSINPLKNMLPRDGIEKSLQEHKNIAIAVIEKNPLLAEEKAKEHIRNTYYRLSGRT